MTTQFWNQITVVGEYEGFESVTVNGIRFYLNADETLLDTIKVGDVLVVIGELTTVPQNVGEPYEYDELHIKAQRITIFSQADEPEIDWRRGVEE